MTDAAPSSIAGVLGCLSALIVGCSAAPASVPESSPATPEPPAVVDPPREVAEKSFGMPLVRRVEVPDGASGVTIPASAGLSAPDSWTTVPHFVTDDGEVLPVVRRNAPDAAPAFDRHVLRRGDDGLWRPDVATALPMVEVIRLEVEASAAPDSARLEVPVPPPIDGSERFRSFEEVDGAYVATLRGTLRVPAWPGWTVSIRGDVTAATLVVETAPMTAAIPTDRSGWLFHGAMVRLPRPIPEPPELADELPVATLGLDQRAPSSRRPSERLFGDARLWILPPSDGQCPGIHLTAASLASIVLAGAPASPRAQSEARVIEVMRVGREGTPKVKARDVRPIGDPAAPPPLPALLHIAGLPVEWTVPLERSAPLALLEAMGTGLRCSGEATRPYPPDGPGVFLNGGHASVAAHQHPDGTWLVVDYGARTAWRADDAGFGAYLAALQERVNEPGVAAWAEAEALCPLPLEKPGKVKEVSFSLRGSGLGGSAETTYTLTPGAGQAFGFEAVRTVTHRGEPQRWTGTVPAHLVDALVAGAAEDTLCREDAPKYEPASDSYTDRAVTVSFAKGASLSLRSTSQHKTGAPWELRLGDFKGTQETAGIGGPYLALLRAMNEDAPEPPRRK